MPLPFHTLYKRSLPLEHGNIRTDAEEEKRMESGDKGRTLFKPSGSATRTNEKRWAFVPFAPYCFPILGGRKVENMLSNIKALDISLSSEQIKYLESILPFDHGFPHTMIGDGTEYALPMSSTAVFETRPLVQPIRPSRE
ncbi:hypothetical protein FB451DRAFT_1405288 [Mycena latifolia]|nr:hypothetical protein FB451DRAFT_1405288 [Mycena latifolia]